MEPGSICPLTPVFTQCFSFRSSDRAEFLNGCQDHATLRAWTLRLSFSPAPRLGTSGASASPLCFASFVICQTSRLTPSGFFSAGPLDFFAVALPSPLMPMMSLTSIAAGRGDRARRSNEEWERDPTDHAIDGWINP